MAHCLVQERFWVDADTKYFEDGARQPSADRRVISLGTRMPCEKSTAKRGEEHSIRRQMATRSPPRRHRR